MTVQPRPRTSVVICTYDPRRFDLLSRAVEAVRSQLGATDELVLVVDNAPALTARCRDTWTDLVIRDNDLGRGLSSARTTGVKHSNGDIIAFLDDDAVPREGWLAALVQRFADPRVVGVSGATRAAWQAGRPTWFPAEFGWVVGCDYRGMPGDGQQVRNPIGANMAFRASALDAVGGFSDALGRVGAATTGCEETEIAIRIREATHGVIVRDLAAVVDHHVPADRGSWRYFVSRCWHEGRSKARLSALVGTGDALSSERRHVLRTLPAGIIGSGPTSGAAIIAGTAVTALGYLTGRVLVDRAPHSLTHHDPIAVEPTAFTPIEVRDIDLDDDSTPAPAPNADGRIAVLGRSRGWPVGFAVFEDLAPDTDVRAVARERFGPAAVAPAHWPADWAVGSDTEVSVVVATLGRRPQLRSVIASILDQTHDRLELLVVDNDPRAGRASQIAAEFDDPRLRVIAQPRRGTSAARNAGIAAATGQIIAFTDDDAIADPTWIAQLAATFALAEPYGRSRLSATTGLVLPHGFSTPTEWHFETATGYGRGFTPQFWSLHPQIDPLGGRAVPGHQGLAYPYAATEFGSGNNMAIRRDVLDRLGGFDEHLGPGTPTEGAEDIDLLRRLLLAGETIVYAPQAIVRHHHRSTPQDLVAQMRGYGVGMGASLTKLVVTSPVHAAGLALRVPRSAVELLSPSSAKNTARRDDHPESATRAEVRGYFLGPWRYLRARWQAGRPR